MKAAVKRGLVYLCNPNNPTASITPKNIVRDFIAAVPNDTMILVDEAYFHYAESPDYESVIPLVQDHPNLLVRAPFQKSTEWRACVVVIASGKRLRSRDCANGSRGTAST